MSAFYMLGTEAKQITWFDFLKLPGNLSDGWDHHLHITDWQTEVPKAEAPGAVAKSETELGQTHPVASVDPPRNPTGGLPHFADENTEAGRGKSLVHVPQQPHVRARQPGLGGAGRRHNPHLCVPAPGDVNRAIVL